MGVVYRACDPKIDRLVAIKTISLAGQEPQEEEEYRERFLQEARAAGRLSHPGIVTIFDAGEDPKTHEPYLVMEYVSGQALSKISLGQDRCLPVETALHYALEIVEALDYAHSQGVIHRDIKPANILITDDDHAKIADFGVARLNHTLTTHTGQIFGSPAYMAPEQLTMGIADARSDLFSVGVMLYSMLTGFRPFQGNSAETVCFKVMHVEPVPVTSFQADLHPGLDGIVSKAIAKDPDERYQSGSALAKDISEFLASNAPEGGTGDSRATWIPQSALPREFRLSSNSRYLKQLAWRAAVTALLIAVLLTAWQVRKDMREVAEFQPPPAPVPSAPAIQKTPNAYYLPRSHSSLPKRETSPTAQVARVHLEILHHFTAAKASVWMDNKIMLEENLHEDDQRHPLLRTLKMNQTANFDVSSGQHQVQIRVVTPDNTYDQSETLESDLAPGSKHVLRVNCDKRKMLVSLQLVSLQKVATTSAARETADKIEKQPFRAASSNQPTKP